MFKLAQSKPMAIFLIFAFLFFCVPELLQSQEVGKGNLVGYVYGPDNTTPVEGAVLKLRNLSTGSLYESMAADDQGMVEFQGVDEGLYLVGISTAQGDFNIDNLVGIKANKTSKIAFALRPQGQEGPLAFFLTPLGAGLVVAASAGVVAFGVGVGEAEKSASAFR